MWTRSDLYSVLGTSNICQAYHGFMFAVLYIYIFKFMHLYKLCILCMGCQKCTHYCYTTHTTVVHIRINFSAQSLDALHSTYFNLRHNLSPLQISFLTYSSLDSGSKFPSAIWKFPEVSVWTKPLSLGTILEFDMCRVVTNAKIWSGIPWGYPLSKIILKL